MPHRYITKEQFDEVNKRMHDLLQEINSLGKDVEVFNIHPDHAESIFTAARILSKVRYAMAEEAV